MAFSSRILLTNDDGIESAGIQLLASALSEEHDVVVAAPTADFSGCGTAIGAFSPSAGVGMSSATSRDHSSHAIDGPPGLAVMSAALGAFGEPPDLVVSGPNAGMNTGHSVIHSGTVGAVLGARTFGISGIALSLARSESPHWDTAAHVGARVVRWVLDNAEEIITLNVNIPPLPLDELKPTRWAHLEEFGYVHAADADVERQLLRFEVDSSEAGSDPHSDTALCRAGHVTITPLTGVETAQFPPVDASELLGI